MALGKILKNAREAKGLSPTDVAEQTNMMVQIVEELENENFHRIAAPIYGRGFLKLYAELLGIDAQPLIDEFMDICSGKIVPELRKRESESVPTQDKPPVLQDVPATAALAEPVAHIPQRADITPHPAVQSLNGIPRPLRKTETSQVEPTITVEENEPQPTQEFESERGAKPVPASEAGRAEQEQAAPEPSSALFDSDEPNLFNTPMQERIAEARRLMDEEQSAEPEPEKKSPLHFGSSTKLPIFQIGGRMDETYEAVPRQTRPTRPRPQAQKQRAPRWDGPSRFFSLVRDTIPFEITKKGVFVYGLLGLIVTAFLIAGISVLFKLTSSSEGGKAKPAVVVEKKVEKQPPQQKPVAQKPAPQKKSVTEGRFPPPPDMYFD